MAPTHIAAAYEAAHLEGAVLVFAASGNEALDRRVAEDARRLGIPVNAVDRPELCDFFTPALVNRAPVAIAIGTEGAGPGACPDAAQPHRPHAVAVARAACFARRLVARRC